jgi:hypothetical protein
VDFKEPHKGAQNECQEERENESDEKRREEARDRKTRKEYSEQGSDSENWAGGIGDQHQDVWWIVM